MVAASRVQQCGAMFFSAAMMLSCAAAQQPTPVPGQTELSTVTADSSRNVNLVQVHFRRTCSSFSRCVPRSSVACI